MPSKMMQCARAVPWLPGNCTTESVCRGKASVVAAASILASVPQQTVAAVETTWVGASQLLKEAADEGQEQVICAPAGRLATSHRCIPEPGRCM